MFYCLVAGSRTINDYWLVRDGLDSLLSGIGDVTIVTGGANGVDALAERYARQHNLPLKVFPADWNKFGKSAGYRRNEQMHQFIAQFPNRGCVCFWDGQSKGTAHNFKLSEQYGTDLRVFRTDTQEVPFDPAPVPVKVTSQLPTQKELEETPF